jgi:hypothetical protein
VGRSSSLMRRGNSLSSGISCRRKSCRISRVSKGFTHTRTPHRTQTCSARTESSTDPT